MAVYVVLHGNRWAVKTDNSERAYKVFDTQAESIAIAHDRGFVQDNSLE